MTTMNNIKMNRRAFLAGTGVTTAALTMGFAVLPEGAVLANTSAKMISPSMYFDIHEDGRIVLHLTKAEMGQHVGTAFAQILAEELGADFDTIELDMVGNDAKYGLLVTGGSWSINWTFDAMSRAGAAGRTILQEAAAEKFGGEPSEYSVENNSVSGNGQSISFGELVANGIEARAFSEEDMAALVLKPQDQYSVIGQSKQAKDIPPKVRGQATYAIDVDLPNMAYGMPLAAPVRYGASVTSIDDSEARKMPGFIKAWAIEDPTGGQTGMVMVVAESYWTAKKAADSLKVEYDLGPTADVSMESIHNESRRLLETGEAERLVVNDGDVKQAMEEGQTHHEAEYVTGMNIHAPMEPMSATVEIKDGVYHIHTGHQFQTLLNATMPDVLGVPAENVVHHQTYLGGAFGRRLDTDHLVNACFAAKEVGRPVKMIYSRETDMQVDYTRPPSVLKMSACTKDGKISGWQAASASSWASSRQFPPFLGADLSGDENKKFDPFAVNGADHWYTMPNQRVLLSQNQIAQEAQPPGHLRSVAPAWQFWAVESFIDEISHANGWDPLETRLAMLDGAGKNAGEGATEGGATRLAASLQKVAELSGYGSERPEGTAVGLACVSSQERPTATWTAAAAEVTVDKETGEFTVDKITIVTDLGIAVNPDGVNAQVTGAAMWGFSISTQEDGEFENGAIQHTNFDTYTPARMDVAPEIEVHIIESSKYPTGCGEPATTVVGPAIANAIQNAVGARVRSLPITAEKVKAAIKT